MKTISLLLAVLMLFSACSPPVASTEEPKPPKPTQTRTEERWIVESIVTDIANLALFSADSHKGALAKGAVVAKKESSPGSHRYEVTISLPEGAETVGASVEIKGSIWSSSNYAPVAATLLKALKVQGGKEGSPASGDTGSDSLSVLSSPLVENLQAENKKVSDWLTRHPLDANAHEQAALVLGVLGLREQSGQFWDTRYVCNRATAFLAFAEALREGKAPISNSGEVGRLLVGLLADTKKESQAIIDSLKARVADQQTLAPWVVAGELRNTRDWRLLPDPSTATLLERLEHFRTECESIDPDIAVQRLRKADPIADWGRIVLQFNFGVGTGRAFTENAVALEVAEWRKVFPEIQDSNLTPAKLTEVLNKEPGDVVRRVEGGGAQLTVIDDGNWARFFQRHLCHVVSQTDELLREKWGVPDQAQQFEEATQKIFGDLTFFPFVREFKGSVRPELKEVIQSLSREHPEWISVRLWEICQRHASLGDGALRMEEWFSPGVPVGTAYGYPARSFVLPKVKNLDRAALETLFEIAPYSYTVARNVLAARHGNSPTPEQYFSVMERFLGFNGYAILRYARLFKTDPVKYAEWMTKAAELDSYNYLRLAEFYVENKMNEEAAATFEIAIKKEVNPIAIANNSEWLVNYYYDRGNKERALEIAKMGAEVYSSQGLQTMANLMEKMGDFAQAEAYFLKIQERYDDSSGLIGFYGRQASSNPGSPYAAKHESQLASLFPKGISEVTLSDFSSPPTQGVMIYDENALLQRSGMKVGSIIVALDGKRVDDFPQYSFVRQLQAVPEMTFIVFQDGKYVERKAVVPKRKFGLDFRTYKK